MKVAIFGASGPIGSRIAGEALDRGHEVTAITADPSRLGPELGGRPGLQARSADATDERSVAGVVRDHDVVISAIGPGGQAGGDVTVVSRAAPALLAGVRAAGGPRLIVVGGAGSLEVAPGLQLVDTPEFPAVARPVSLAHREALEACRSAGETLDWTYASPAGVIQPGERTGTFRLGADQLLVDANGESKVSMEDFAIAILDEAERPAHTGRRFTVAY